jgi:enolase
VQRLTITAVNAIEILDSRGRPTVKATCFLDGGFVGSASVPSGASTGAAEAHELRDGDPSRYRGQGCRNAVQNINGEINDAVQLCEFADQKQFDQRLIALDGTPNKSRLGANAILALSIAFARAVAAERGDDFSLWHHFARMIGRVADSLPRLTINLFSGGKHAGGQMPIQDILIVPTADTIEQGLADAYAVYQAAADLTQRKYGMRALTADEGGLAPPFPSAEAALDDAVESIEASGVSPTHVGLAVDVASSHFYHDGRYVLGAEALSPKQMIERLAKWVAEYPLLSVEDGLAEEDWDHWPLLRERVGRRGRLVLGDDLLCTNPRRIRRAIETNAANALLLKVNQIGTLTEAAEALKLARDAGWRVTISARSGETEDNWLADLAVGWGGDQIKVGSITQSERLAKYNRLLEIEGDSQPRLPVVSWPGRLDD